MSTREISYVAINEIKLDPNNPRINFIHERMENPDDPQIELELNDNTQKYNDLRKSIFAFGGIFNPIILSKTKKGGYLCVEGNTRLSLYREFSESSKEIIDLNPDKWKKIPAMVFDSEDIKELEIIRLQAHLVGPREWPKINKARYVYQLINESILTDDEIAASVGGTMSSIRSLARGYENYIKHFVPSAKGDVGDKKLTGKFSGIEEYSAPRIQAAVKEHLGDDHWKLFSKWLMETDKDRKKFRTMAQVRKLEVILHDDQAREEFLSENGNVDSALKKLEDDSSITQSVDDLFKAFCKAVEDNHDNRIQTLAERLYLEIEDWDEKEWDRIQEEENDVFEAVNLLKTKLDKLYLDKR